MRIPFVTGSYEAYSKDAIANRLVNLYIEVIPESGKTRLEAYGTPGLERFVDFGAEPVRGHPLVVGDYMYVVQESTFYQVDNSGTKTPKGTLNTSGGYIEMADNGVANGQQIIVVDGTNGYIYDIGADSFNVISDADYPDTATSVTFVGGRFVTNSSVTGRYYYSALYDGTSWGALDYATAESDPDDLVKPKGHGGRLYLFGEFTLEPHYQTPSADLPFARIGGATSQVGCKAGESISTLGDTLAWLGQTKDGGIKVCALQGNQPIEISHPALERKISEYEKDSGVSDAVAYSYTESGHTFYVLQFPSAGKTHVCDLSVLRETGRADLCWHERESSGGRHYSQYYARFVKSHIVTDYSSGKIFKMRDDIYTDNGTPKSWRMITPVMHADNKKMTFGRIQVDIEAGLGATTGPGSDPKMSLRYSDDGGHTWSNKKIRSMGKRGEYSRRVIWNRCGSSYNRAWELSGAEPIKTVISGATSEVLVEA